MQNRRVGAQQVTVATTTVLFQSIPKVAIATELTVISGRIVQALQTLASLLITVSRAVRVHIIATFTLLAGTAGQFRISVVVVCADIAPGSGVALLAMAYHIIGARIQAAAVRMRVS